MKLGLGFVGHTAVRVGHHQNSVYTEEVGGKNKSAEYVVCDSSAGISQDLRVSGLHANECKRADS
jgi:septum formation inhibitor-activating ATPase MinD